MPTLQFQFLLPFSFYLLLSISAQFVPRNGNGVPLHNYDQQLLQVQFLRNQRFNTSLSETDSFVVNHRVYAFQWKNNQFTRLPFTTNVTFADCDQFAPEVARVSTPLKNRFAARPANATQMNCPLHVRFIENNHYIGKYNRIGMQFTSPCLDNPVFKYALNKNGLRTTLTLQLLGEMYTFQFRTAVTATFGRSPAETFQEFRMLNPTHHSNLFPSRQYLRQNVTNLGIRLQGEIFTPTQVLAMQAEALKSINDNYAKQLLIYNATNHNGTYQSRNEIFPRRRSLRHDQKNKRGGAHSFRSDGFVLTKDSKKRTREILERLAGRKNYPAFRKLIKMQINRMMTIQAYKNGINPAVILKTPSRISGFRSAKRKLGIFPRNLSQKKIGKAKKVAWSTKFKAFLKVKKTKHDRKLGHGRKLFLNRELDQMIDMNNLIIANEPYKVDTCQRICTARDYYSSWNFCLRVCGFEYHFLSNIRDIYGRINLFPGVPFQRIASESVFLPATRQPDQLFTLEQILSIKNAVDVVSCGQTWTRLNCSFVSEV